MLVNYGSPAHIISIIAPFVFCASVYFLLRGKSVKIQKRTILVLMLTNLFQHVLKSFIYPHLFEVGFGVMNTAYNMCALLIILSPVAYLVRFSPLKDFVFWIGSVAGIVAILIPYWHIGESPFSWEYARYMICHVLLFSNSALPLLLGHHKTAFRRFPLMGVEFLAAIGLILLNDTLCYYFGLFGDTVGKGLFEVLAIANPVWSFGPPESFGFLGKYAAIFLPDSWCGANSGNTYLPFIWYAIPLYLVITVIVFLLFMFADHESFRSDLSKISQKIKKLKCIFKENAKKS